MTNDPLCDLIMEQSPEGFWSELRRRQEALYREAYAYAHHGTLWEHHDALSVFPIVRRAVFESALRNAARTNGLKAYDRFHDGENYPYVLVKNKKLVITCHHVSSPDCFVRPAQSRKQNAAINDWLDYYRPPRDLLLRPLPELRNSGKINLYVLHGQQPVDAEKTAYSSFLRIAIPNSKLTEYQRNYDVQEVLNLYTQRDRTKEISELQISDRALPRLKKDA
jgi:hypothetical protein